MPKASKDGLVAALEIMVNTPAVANIIRQGTLDKLENSMMGGRKDGMITMDTALRELFNKGVITGRAAYQAAITKKTFEDIKDLEI